MQHEIKRKEKEYERLQERCGRHVEACGVLWGPAWPPSRRTATRGCSGPLLMLLPLPLCPHVCAHSRAHPSTHTHTHTSTPPSTPRRLAHYLADKKRSEKAALDMAGKLTQQLQARLGWCGVWGWGWRVRGANWRSIQACVWAGDGVAFVGLDVAGPAARQSYTSILPPSLPHTLSRKPRARRRTRRGRAAGAAAPPPPCARTRASRRWWLPTRPNRWSWARKTGT